MVQILTMLWFWSVASMDGKLLAGLFVAVLIFPAKVKVLKSHNDRIEIPSAELFTIRMHYTVGEVEGMAGFIDYCCADQMSRLELLSMATEFGLDLEGSSVWYLQLEGDQKGLKEIKNDLDALHMAMSVDSSKEVYVYIKQSTRVGLGEGVTTDRAARQERDERGDNEHRDLGRQGGQEEQGEDVEEEVVEDCDLESILLGIQCGGKTLDEENDFHDSDFSFSDSDKEEGDTSARPTAENVVPGDSAFVGMEVDAESDYVRSEELQSCSSTDDEFLVPKRSRYSEFNEEIDMKNPQFKIGMKFRSFKQFKQAVKNYGIRHHYVMNFKPNNKRKCKAYCKKGCPFYLWASPMVKDKDTAQIKTGILKHECSREHVNRHVNAEWIAKNYLEQFRADPTWKIAGIIQAVKTNQEVDISRLKAYRAKCIAHRIIDGDEESQMVRLYDYRLELIKTHPSSTVVLECNDEGIFQALYICLAPLREGFLAGCRQLISLDGCFLKGLYGGQLLSAVGIDANDCIYPIAWAVVSKENKENWKWFLQILAQDLGIYDSKEWTFMTDRQKGGKACAGGQSQGQTTENLFSNPDEPINQTTEEQSVPVNQPGEEQDAGINKALEDQAATINQVYEDQAAVINQVSQDQAITSLG